MVNVKFGVHWFCTRMWLFFEKVELFGLTQFSGQVDHTLFELAVFLTMTIHSL